MCFPFGSCFGCGGSVHDFGREPTTTKHAAAMRALPTPYHPPARNVADHGQQRNGNYGNGHKASAAFAGADATRDGYGHAAYAQGQSYTYSAADQTLKLPATARSNKVGDDKGYKAGFHGPAAKQDTTDSYYPTTATVARNA